MSGLQPLVATGRQRGERLGELVLQGTEDERERRTKLVAHIREERRLHPIELGEGVRLGALLLVCARIGERGTDRCRDEVVEGAITLAYRQTRADARDHHSRGLLASRLRNGE